MDQKPVMIKGGVISQMAHVYVIKDMLGKTVVVSTSSFE